MRELVITPSFSSEANSQLYLASFSLWPNDLRKYIYGGLDYPICFKSKCFDEKFRAELSNHAEVLVDRLIEKKSKSFNEDFTRWCSSINFCNPATEPEYSASRRVRRSQFTEIYI